VRLSPWITGPLLSSLALALCAVALEICLRTTGIQPPFFYQLDEETCATHIPGLTATLTTADYHTTVTFNSAGSRDVERSLLKRPSALRVALLGDSFIEAVQVPLERTAAQVAQSGLQRRFPGRAVEVLNFGCAGFGTTCSYLTLRRRAFAYDPDVVVLAFYLGNDLYDNHPELAVEPNRPFYEIAPDGSLELRPFRVVDSPIKRWLRSHSRAFAFVRDRVKRLAALHRAGIRLGIMQPAATGEQMAARRAERRSAHNQYLVSPSPLIDEAWRVTDRLIDRMAENVRLRGMGFLVVIIPTTEQFDDVAAERYLAANPALRGPGGDRSRGAIDFELPARRLRGILDRHEIPFVDLLTTFRATRRTASDLYYPSDGHWTPLGNLIAGTALVDVLADMIAQRSDSPTLSVASDREANERPAT
jgi:hypothetical protein